MELPLHGGQLRHIAARFGVPAVQLLDFSANINPAGPPAAVLASLSASLEDLSTLTAYPDLEEAELKRAIARYASVRAENVAVANGFVPLLDTALRVLGVRRCLLPAPAFVEYRKALDRAGVEVTAHPLPAEASFAYDITAMLSGDHDAILLANPQNPSGVCHDAATLRELASLAARKNMYVLLDEAFIDYIPEHSLSAAVDEFPNLIVFRSVTKFHGMPGLRVAYALASPARIAALNQALPPWPITTLASRAVAAALEDKAYSAHSLEQNRVRAELLRGDLAGLGLTLYPSAANFFLFCLPPGIDADWFWQHMIAAHGVVLRACGNYEALPAEHFRVAIRGEGDNARLVRALGQALAVMQDKPGKREDHHHRECQPDDAPR